MYYLTIRQESADNYCSTMCNDIEALKSSIAEAQSCEQFDDDDFQIWKLTTLKVQTHKIISIVEEK